MKTRRRPPGPQVPHRRPRRPGAGRSSASCRSRSPAATSTRRSSAARSTPPSGSAPMTTRSSASTRSRRTTTIPAGGRAAPSIHFFFNMREVGRAAEGLQGDRCSGGRGYANVDMQAKYDARNPAALRRLVGGGAQLRPFPQEIMEACLQGGERALRRDSRPRTPDLKKVYERLPRLPERGVPLVPGRRVHLRQLHDPRPRAGGRFGCQTPRPRVRPGLFCAAMSTDRGARGVPAERSPWVHAGAQDVASCPA